MQDSSRFRAVLAPLTADTQLHAKLLNTLSYMEHVGATKIAASQSGPSATFMTLKHASEEARHAWYLKKLALRLAPDHFPDYRPENLLAPVASRQYLHRLDVAACRMCRNAGLEGRALRDLAYLLVTWAIEVRADALYPVYQEFLSQSPVKLSVASIINEEVGHLEEMNTALAAYPPALGTLTQEIAKVEADLFEGWVAALEKEVDHQPVRL
jgi:hypothetical protein